MKNKYIPIKKVEYIVQDCPILGKKIVTHYVEVNNKKRKKKALQNQK